jgi:hypothetical protein
MANTVTTCDRRRKKVENIASETLKRTRKQNDNATDPDIGHSTICLGLISEWKRKVSPVDKKDVSAAGSASA